MLTCAKCRKDHAPVDTEAYLGARWCVQCIDRDLGLKPRPLTGGVAKPKPFPDTSHLIALTTAPTLAGHRIVETIDIVTAECVFGMNLFADIFAGFSDVFGGRSETTQRTLRDARTTCLAELRREAARVGANAVIAVDLDYSELSGKGKSMLFLVASGTAVVVVPDPDSRIDSMSAPIA